MKSLYLKYNRSHFWAQYWKEHDVDYNEFVDTTIYPIEPTLRHVDKGDKILECGVGGGRIMRHLTKHGYDITGVEYDEEIVNKLRSTDSKINVCWGDITNLQFDDNSYNKVLCFGVLAGLKENTAVAVTEMKRVTTADGIIIVSVMLDNWARAMQKRINNLLSKEENDFYAWMDTANGWQNYFKTFGLRTIEISPIVSRYSIFYWTPFLRAGKSDLTKARVDEREYLLNPLGELVWLLHRDFFRWQFAMGSVFVLQKE